MRLRLLDASIAPREVYYGAPNGPGYRPRPGHLARTGVYARRDSLTQILCLSARSKFLILQGRFAQFALPGMGWFWAANHGNH